MPPAALAMRSPVRLPSLSRSRTNTYDKARAKIRSTPVKTEAYGLHVHVVEISDNGNGWTDPHPDGTRHEVRELDFLPATHDTGRPAFDGHRHDIAGRAKP